MTLRDTEVVMQDVAILFCDIRNFTTMAEKLAVAEVSRLLAEYFDRACECVTGNGGHHIKVMGDGLMAVFDDTTDGPGAHAKQAIAASMDLVRVAADFQHWLDTWLHGRGLPEFAIGIGLNAGEVMFGRLGTGAAAEVTPLGDAVNIAARLESMSKELGWAVVASEALVQLARGQARIGRRDRVELRGREGSLGVCEILGLTSGQPPRTITFLPAAKTLRGLVGTRLAAHVVVDIAGQCAVALGALHADGWVHGHLRPEHVTLRDGGGIELAGLESRAHIGSAPRHRTPYYCSPQAALGEPAAPQDDFYSLGVILHELLTQRLPFTASSLELLVARHLHAAVPELPAECAAFQPLMDRLLAKSRDARFADAHELAAFIGAMPLPAPPA